MTLVRPDPHPQGTRLLAPGGLIVTVNHYEDGSPMGVNSYAYHVTATGGPNPEAYAYPQPFDRIYWHHELRRLDGSYP